MASITYSDECTQLTLDVRPATFKNDLERIEHQDAAASQKWPSVAIMAAAVFTFPRLIHCTPSGEVILNGTRVDWPLTFEQFLELSAEAVNTWYDEAERLNPRWFVLPKPDEEKKASESAPTKD